MPAAPLSNGGFANVKVTMNNVGAGQLVVAHGTTLKVQPGGSITLTDQGGNPVNILGDLTAISGSISIAGGGDVTVGAGAVLDAAGEWVNDSGQPDAAGATNFINGGSITVATTGENTVLLSPGSMLDVSSGGAMLFGGQLAAGSNGIPLGKGGSVALETGSFVIKFGITIPGGPIEMEGTIESFGFAGGGTLTLQASGFQIGGDPATTPVGDVYLPADFFEGQGFGAYVLNGFFDTRGRAWRDGTADAAKPDPQCDCLGAGADGRRYQSRRPDLDRHARSL